MKHATAMGHFRKPLHLLRATVKKELDKCENICEADC